MVVIIKKQNTSVCPLKANLNKERYGQKAITKNGTTCQCLTRISYNIHVTAGHQRQKQHHDEHSLIFITQLGSVVEIQKGMVEMVGTRNGVLGLIGSHSATLRAKRECVWFFVTFWLLASGFLLLAVPLRHQQYGGVDFLFIYYYYFLYISFWGLLQGVFKIGDWSVPLVFRLSLFDSSTVFFSLFLHIVLERERAWRQTQTLNLCSNNIIILSWVSFSCGQNKRWQC